MKNLALAIIGVFVAILFVLVLQQGHGYGKNTFFFIHKTALIIVDIAIIIALCFVWVRIPKK